MGKSYLHLQVLLCDNKYINQSGVSTLTPDSLRQFCRFSPYHHTDKDAGVCCLHMNDFFDLG